MMNSKMKSQSSTLRNLLVASFPCISRTTNVLAETAALWVQKIYAYVQSELQEFSDIQEGSAEVEQHTDPAFVAYIKGEIPEPGVDCRQIVATEKCESHNLKKTARQKTKNKAGRAKKHTPTCQKRNMVGSEPDLRMKPPLVEELVFRRRRSFISTEKVSQSSTDHFRQQSRDQAKFAGEHHLHDCSENYTQESAARDSNNSQIDAEKNTHLRLPGI